jgi:hypothetical protein
MLNVHKTRSLCSALVLVAGASSAAQAQTVPDRLELHGALNVGYGRAQDFQVLGIPLAGTSDYRVFTLQGRYSLDDNDQIVAQIFNRRLGKSPLAGAISDVTMQWAYWQHKTGDFTFKAGRNPLPRGLSNETRYIGTVHPFFRPPVELQQDAFDAIDGAVASYRKDAANGVGFEQYAFGGGSENRAIATTSTGQEVRVARTENMFGGQSYLRLPVANARFGAYGARYNFVQATSSGYRTNVILSAEATPIDRLKLETEHGRITGHGPNNDNRSGYYEGTLRLTDRLSVAGQNAYTNRMLFFTNSNLNFVLPEVRTNGASAIIALTSNAVLKFENHWRRGWSYDTPTPPVAAQTPTSVTLAPELHSRYYLISLAASF